jgi:hypothetical protein
VYVNIAVGSCHILITSSEKLSGMWCILIVPLKKLPVLFCILIATMELLLAMLCTTPIGCGAVPSNPEGVFTKEHRCGKGCQAAGGSL